MTRLLIIAGLLLTILAGTAASHDTRPGYLAVTEISADTYSIVWKVPATGDLRLALYPSFPESVVETTPREGVFLSDSFIERWQVRVLGGFSGKQIAVDGLPAIRTDVLVRVENLDGDAQTARLTSASPAFVVAEAQSSMAVAQSYFELGVEHIILGVDHLLFVLGLLLLLGDWKRLALTITAFTVAHSITLAAATLGLVRVPERLVNTLIALSILFLAVEVARSWRGEKGLTSRQPWLVAFGFGLLHGFGFASGLTALGLPASDIPLALLSFNLGVEAGQLAFVALVLLLRQAFAVLQFRWSPATAALPCYVVGAAGAYWSIDRLTPLVMDTHMTPGRVALAYTGFAILAADVSFAHVGDSGHGGLASGFLHPIAGLDHVLAMVAVGLWGAQLGAPALWALPIAFPLVMAFGGFLGLLGISLPGVETAIALSAVALGLAVLCRFRPPLVVAVCMVGVFALFHGHAHGTELPEGATALAYSTGFVVATGLLHLLGIGFGVAWRWNGGQALVRAAGSAIALGGVGFLTGVL